jgi:hypothetical protein
MRQARDLKRVSANSNEALRGWPGTPGHPVFQPKVHAEDVDAGGIPGSNPREA